VRIPRIGINTAVIAAGYTADEWDVPRFTAAYYWPLSAYPGTIGNIVIAGHVGYSGIIFDRLPEAQIGDEVFVKVAGQERRYVVFDVLTVLPHETWVMKPTPTETLTLYTCYPLGIYTHRLVVRAIPTEQPWD
jgi:LPXTG-site transpeptidase (sortase) family protein